MRVGILTFHNAYNYGAILQAYATQELVKSYGHEVEVIDYHNRTIDKFYDNKRFHFYTLPKRRFYRIPFYIVEKIYFRKRRIVFKQFLDKYIHLSKPKYYQGERLFLKDYDIIMIGSDQLWNKNLTGGFDRVYWGEFGVPHYTKKIGWSICMNEINTTEEDNTFIIDHLKNFSAVSVREQSLQVFLRKLTRNNYPWTLDPTLMLNRERWDCICHPVAEKDYIAVYAVQNEREAIEYARQVARVLNKKIIIIRSYSKHYWSDENKEYAGPSEFLSYIKNADFIVTTSFHGTVFSMVFQKQFVCPVFKENNRIESLLGLAGLRDRRISPNTDIRNLTRIDYTVIGSKIDAAREKTKVFLDSFLLQTDCG